MLGMVLMVSSANFCLDFPASRKANGLKNFFSSRISVQ